MAVGFLQTLCTVVVTLTTALIVRLVTLMRITVSVIRIGTSCLS
nr:MAG TPA: hypothetical protein [Caudoviricetes sp.]